MDTQQKTTELVPDMPALPASASPAVQQVHVTFAEIMAAQRDALRHAVNIQIVDNATLTDALAISKACKKSVDSLAEVRKAATQEAEIFLAAAKEREKAFAQVFTNAKAAVDNKVQAYNLRKAEEARLEKVRIENELRAAREREDAERRQREAEETARQVAEAQRLADQRRAQEAEIAKADESQRLALQLQAEQQQQAEQARLDKERADREAAQRIADERAKIELERAEREALTATAAANSAGKTKGVAVRWTYEVKDPDLVTRGLCEPSPGKIRKAVNAGLRNTNADGTPNVLAAGLVIYQDISTVAR
jgi:hypothetical protein